MSTPGGLELLTRGHAHLEAPRWRSGNLWVSDFYTDRVLGIDDTGTIRTEISVPGHPSGLGWLPTGEMLIVSMQPRQVLRYDGHKLHVHADLSKHAPFDLNDMVVDSSGRAYVGGLGFDALGGAPVRSSDLIRVDADGTTTIAATDLLMPNGSVISADERTFIVSESFGNRLTMFNIGSNGELTDRRVWIEFGPTPTAHDAPTAISQMTCMPDGLALDTAGGIWVADAIGHRALYIRDGQIESQLSTADLGSLVVACALGGDDGRTLFLCTTPSHDPDECLRMMDSAILTTTVEFPRAGLP